MNSNSSWQRSVNFADTAKDYLQNPGDYVRLFDVTINGKLRHLVTYMPNEKGRALRMLHTDFAQYLQTQYAHARCSYAYTKRRSIVDCVNRHLSGEVFLKTDIHAYFESITLDNLEKCLKKLKITGRDPEMTAIFTKACFYQGHIPLGFTSSPTISDVFLVRLDRKYQRRKTLTYTRYADDFIVSASGPDAEAELSSFRAELEKDLQALDLELNRKKTYLRHLRKPGDAIHVLGVNIVRNETGPNRITISDRYVRETCKELCEWLGRVDREDDKEEFAALYGKINFIRQCSQSSFDKLQKMTKIKCGYDGPLTLKALK